MAKKKTKWPVIAGIAFIVIFIAAMAYSTLGNTQQRCEVCITYKGQTNCGSSASASKEQAERAATDIACNSMTHGMTELVQCQNAERKVTWK
jgi:hypothetical protein